MAVKYTTAVEVRNQVNDAQSTHDSVLETIIEAAEAAIDGYCNRPDGFLGDTEASARVFSGSGEPVQWIDECVAITQVAVKPSVTSDSYTAWEATDWIPFSGDPLSPDFNNLPYHALMTAPAGSHAHFTSGKYTSQPGFRPTDYDGPGGGYSPSHTYKGRGVPTVQVTARWGYALVVPPQVKQATITQTARWFMRARSAWADTMADGNFGLLSFKKTLDPDVEMMLSKARLVKPPTGIW